MSRFPQNAPNGRPPGLGAGKCHGRGGRFRLFTGDIGAPEGGMRRCLGIGLRRRLRASEAPGRANAGFGIDPETAALSSAQEKQWLQQQADELQQRLDQLHKRMADLNETGKQRVP